MQKFRNLLASFLVVFSSLTLGLTALAATNSSSTSGNGMKVSPVRTDLVITPGNSKVVSVFVTNVTSSTETLQVIRNDFVANTDESGAPNLLLNGQSNDKHGLKKYMSAVSKITVQPGQQQKVAITVTIPSGTPGGGYYGAVRFAPVTSSNGSNVSLSSSVASLILVKVPGNVTEKLTIAGLNAVDKDGNAHTLFTSSKNISAAVRFQNEGNIQEQPFGKVQLMRGSKVLGTYKVNDINLPGNVLPDSIRKFTVPLSHVGSFGKYTLQGSFGYGSNGQLLTGSTTFYVVPVPVIILAIIVIIIILFLIFGLPRMIRGYNRRVLRRAGRR